MARGRNCEAGAGFAPAMGLLYGPSSFQGKRVRLLRHPAIQPINTAGETLKRFAKAFTWRVLRSRLPASISETMP
jgi:hypothetical protein